MIKQQMVGNDVCVKRIYLGGLQSDVSSEEISRRFSCFGSVSDVELIKNDNGECRGFAYMNISMPLERWLKCLSTYQHSKWRGKQLCLLDAKPNYIDQMRARIVSLPSTKKPVKQKVKGPIHYKLMDIVTNETAKKYPGWKLSRQNKAIYVMRIRQGKTFRVLDPTKSRVRVHKRFGDLSTIQPYSIEKLTWSLRDNRDPCSNLPWLQPLEIEDVLSSSDSESEEARERKRYLMMTVEEQIECDTQKNNNIMKLFMKDEPVSQHVVDFCDDGMMLNFSTGIDFEDMLDIEKLRDEFLQKNEKTPVMPTYHSDSGEEKEEISKNTKTVMEKETEKANRQRDILYPSDGNDTKHSSRQSSNDVQMKNTGNSNGSFSGKERERKVENSGSNLKKRNSANRPDESSDDDDSDDRRDHSMSDLSADSSSSEESSDDEEESSAEDDNNNNIAKNAPLSSLFTQTVNNSEEIFSFLDDSTVVLPERKTKIAVKTEWTPKREKSTSLPLHVTNLLRHEAPFFYPSAESSESNRSTMKDLLDVNNKEIPLFCTESTEDEIRQEWIEKRQSLTEEYKKRHKDAVKKKQKANRGKQK